MIVSQKIITANRGDKNIQSQRNHWNGQNINSKNSH